VFFGRFLPDLSRIPTLLASLAIVAIYFGLLTLLREVGPRDLDAVKAIVRRR
jgi:hypothetical protein